MLKKAFLEFGYTEEELQMIQNSYALRDYLDEALIKKLNDLSNFLGDLGYKREEIRKATKNFPSLLSLSTDIMKRRIGGLISLGYSYDETIKMMKNYPQLFSYTTENIRKKMTDIESLVKRIIIIGNGRKLYDGDIDNIKKKYSSEKIVEIYYENLKGIPKVDGKVVSNENGIIKSRIDSKRISVSDVVMKFANVCEIKDINVIAETIDNIIYKLYKDYQV